MRAVASLMMALLGMAAAGTAGAAPAQKAATAIEQREPTAGERASFDAYFRLYREAEAARGIHTLQPLFAPAFDIERRRGQPWQVIARVDSAPRHVGTDLCGQYRSSFIYQSGTAQRWTVSAAPPALYVWPAQPATICTIARQTVLMDPSLVPEHVTPMLRQQAALLARARLLLAGNSQCARQRALNFTLAAVEPAPPANGAPQMYAMVFRSDRDTTVRIGVRKRGPEYTAWSVSCPG